VHLHERVRVEARGGWARNEFRIDCSNEGVALFGARARVRNWWRCCGAGAELARMVTVHTVEVAREADPDIDVRGRA
jgi:hypothetical protein